MRLSPLENARLAVELDGLMPTFCTLCGRPSVEEICPPCLHGAEGSPFAVQAEPEVTTSPWLQCASDLLARPDPGPTPWLVQDLIVDEAIVAVAGRWKTTKTYALLDVAISVVTGRPFLARLEVANPGPVIVVIEESGESALWRRLDSLSRGRAIPRDELADLHYAANKRIRLDDLEWQNELLAAGHAIGPRLIILDPLARLKAPGRDENAQAEYAVLVEFIRRLRDETGSAVAFVQHTGHTGGHMRGTSDLESVWESRLGFRRDSSTVTIDAEHREAESAAAISYRLKWDDQTRTIRLEELADSVPAKVARYLADNPGASANEVAKELGGNRQEVLAEVRRQRSEGGSDGQNHRGTTSAGSGSGSGSPAGSLPKGNQAGTTPALPGSVSGNHPSESEVDRLEALAGEMGL